MRKAEIKNEIKEEIKEDINKETPLALVTGASGGIGYAIAVKLSAMGYRVYGIGRDFGKVPGGYSSATLPFNPIELDLRKKGAAESISGLLRQEGRLRILVHAAGVAYYGFHETVHPERLQEMVEVNLTIPMVLTRHFLRELKEEKGHIFFIDSITALHENVYGAAYGATKAGLLSFARSLFQEQRNGTESAQYSSGYDRYRTLSKCGLYGRGKSGQLSPPFGCEFRGRDDFTAEGRRCPGRGTSSSADISAQKTFRHKEGKSLNRIQVVLYTDMKK